MGNVKRKKRRTVNTFPGPLPRGSTKFGLIRHDMEIECIAVKSGADAANGVQATDVCMPCVNATRCMQSAAHDALALVWNILHSGPGSTAPARPLLSSKWNCSTHQVKH